MTDTKSFYLIGSIKNVERIKELIEFIEAETEYECALDWTNRIMSPDSTSYQRQQELWRELNAIDEVDIVIALPPLGRSSHVELGYAIANMTSIVMIGEEDTNCLAYEVCEFAKDYDELVAHLDAGTWEY